MKHTWFFLLAAGAACGGSDSALFENGPNPEAGTGGAGGAQAGSGGTSAGTGGTTTGDGGASGAPGTGGATDTGGSAGDAGAAGNAGSAGAAGNGGAGGAAGSAGAGGTSGAAGTGGARDGGPVADGSKSDGATPEGGMFCSGTTFPTFIDACANTESCSFGLHQIDCCGTKLALGFNHSYRDEFDKAEMAWRNACPANCKCPTGPTIAQDGQTGMTGDVRVECQDRINGSLGHCKTFFP